MRPRSGPRRGGASDPRGVPEVEGSTTDRLTDPEYIRFQYGDDERLRTRIETHRRYSEDPGSFTAWVLERVAARPGDRILDVGCGHGQYHAELGQASVVGIDTSLPLLRQVGVLKVQGDAQALPFRSASFDRVMANHMLFHVPDRERALREMRRVARPGGRVVLTTNGADDLRLLFDIHNEVAAELGIPRAHTVASGFSLDDIAVVRSAFPAARVEVRRDAFVFREPEPVLAYLGTQSAGLLGPVARRRYFEAVEVRVRKILAEEGVLRIPKTAGCFIADL